MDHDEKIWTHTAQHVDDAGRDVRDRQPVRRQHSGSGQASPRDIRSRNWSVVRIKNA